MSYVNLCQNSVNQTRPIREIALSATQIGNGCVHVRNQNTHSHKIPYERFIINRILLNNLTSSISCWFHASLITAFYFSFSLCSVVVIRYSERSNLDFDVNVCCGFRLAFLLKYSKKKKSFLPSKCSF